MANESMMQLRVYFFILRRYWPIILLLPLLVGGLSAASLLRQPLRYQASARFMVTRSVLEATAPVELPNYNDSYSWSTSEYILDDLPQILSSRLFAQDVQAILLQSGLSVDLPLIQSAISAETLHRSVSLMVTADSPDLALAIAQAAEQAVQQHGLKYWGRGDAGGLVVMPIDPAQAGATLGGWRSQLGPLGIRVILGLIAGLGLALALHYFDNRLRTSQQAEELIGARVLGAIPKE